MLIGAFFGAWGADVTSSWVGGILIGIAAGGVIGLLHAVFAVSLRADQIVSGTAINFLAVGITGFLFVKIYGTQGTPGRPARDPRRAPADRLDPVPRRRARAAQPADLGRADLRRGALAVPVPDAARAAPALRRGEPARRGHGGHLADPRPLPRGHRLRRVRGARRRVPLDRLRPLVQREHDGGQGLHRPGRGDLRQVEARAARSPRRCCSASAARSRSGSRCSRRRPRRCSRRCRTCSR